MLFFLAFIASLFTDGDSFNRVPYVCFIAFKGIQLYFYLLDLQLVLSHGHVTVIKGLPLHNS